MTAPHSRPVHQPWLTPATLDRPSESTTPPCLADPDRWIEGGDDPELKALCRGCPRRWLCAKEALETPGAEGMWSGVYIPSQGRARRFAMRQLHSLATHAGYDVGPEHG